MSRRWLPLGLVLGLGLLATACSDAAQVEPPTTTSTTTPPATLVEQAVRASLPGVPSSSYRVGAQVVEGHPSWVRFTTVATPEAAASFQGGYGFAELRGGRWEVVVAGSALVGCPLPGESSGLVPVDVLAASGQRCPKR